jgi:hypothetical protein
VTKGGPRTDGDARVPDLDGRPIPGLDAAGNVMASAMGMTYGGAGGRWDQGWCSATSPADTPPPGAGDRSIRCHGGVTLAGV